MERRLRGTSISTSYLSYKGEKSRHTDRLIHPPSSSGLANGRASQPFLFLVLFFEKYGNFYLEIRS